MSKLNDLQRQDIINSLADGVSSGVLGRKYGVNRSSIIAIKKKNGDLIRQRKDQAKTIKEQSYYLALTKLKARLEESEKIPILTLVQVLRELNNQIIEDGGDQEEKEVTKYKRLSGGEIEQKIKGLLAEYKHIKKLDHVTEVKTTE
jgi:hypothetical protein